MLGRKRKVGDTKLLVMGGKPIGSREIVRYARERGAHVVVADYLAARDSPAKVIADEHWEVSTADVGTLAKRCREEGVNAVLSGVHEFNIERSMELCNILGVPFYCTLDQWRAFEDKGRFKQLCSEHGLNVAREYDPCCFSSIPEDAFPLAIKPLDGSGSRGFSKCRDPKALQACIELAVSASPSGKVLIEEYIDAEAAIVHYTVHNGQAVFSGMADKHSERVGGHGAPAMALQMAPSIHQEKYLSSCDLKVRKLLSDLGLMEGPLWIEVFCKDGQFVFNEAGYRFGGSMTPYLVEEMSGIDQMELMYDFATGKKDMAPLKVSGPRGLYAILPLHVRPGVIDSISGVNEMEDDSHTVALVPVHDVGDEIGDWGSARQVFAYLHVKAATVNGLLDAMSDCVSMLSVKDGRGEEMLALPFDPRDSVRYPAFLTERLSNGEGA